MKVFVAHLTFECNEHVSQTVDIGDFRTLYGNECIDAMHIRDIFEENDIEIIPSILAGGVPGGMIERTAFDFMENKILTTLKQHLKEIDGVYLQFHGASGVLNLEDVSAEHHIVKRIREIVGKYMPVAMIMDPHGNVTRVLTDNVNIVRCYRESPHSDQVDSERIVAEKLVDLMQNRRPMRPVLRKLPIMVGGERSVSAMEPVKSINALLDKAEEDERVFSISWHVGYIRHDDDKLGAAIVVVPNKPEDREYCEKVADEISEFVWQHHKEFKFSGNYDEPWDAVRNTLQQNKKTSVITDSGDNCGAGGSGQNTVMLREFLKQNVTDKKVLIAGINDPKANVSLNKHQIGDSVEFDLGVGEDELSAPVHIQGKIIAVGDEYNGLGHEKVAGKSLGKCPVVRIDDTLIDVLVMDKNVQYGNMDQFEKAGVHFHDYDIVVVKMGYLDTYLIPETAYHNMALTDGPTIQRAEKIPYKKIPRPIWPTDEFEDLYYIDRT